MLTSRVNSTTSRTFPFAFTSRFMTNFPTATAFTPEIPRDQITSSYPAIILFFNKLISDVIPGHDHVFLRLCFSKANNKAFFDLTTSYELLDIDNIVLSEIILTNPELTELLAHNSKLNLDSLKYNQASTYFWLFLNRNLADYIRHLTKTQPRITYSSEDHKTGSFIKKRKLFSAIIRDFSEPLALRTGAPLSLRFTSIKADSLLSDPKTCIQQLIILFVISTIYIYHNDIIPTGSMNVKGLPFRFIVPVVLPVPRGSSTFRDFTLQAMSKLEPRLPSDLPATPTIIESDSDKNSFRVLNTETDFNTEDTDDKKIDGRLTLSVEELVVAQVNPIIQQLREGKITPEKAQLQVEEAFSLNVVDLIDLSIFSKGRGHWSSKIKYIYNELFSDDSPDFSSAFFNQLTIAAIKTNNTPFQDAIIYLLSQYFNSESTNNFDRNRGLFILVIQSFLTALSDKNATVIKTASGDSDSFEKDPEGVYLYTLARYICNHFFDTVDYIAYICFDPDTKPLASPQLFFEKIQKTSVKFFRDHGLLEEYINFRDHSELQKFIIPSEKATYVQKNCQLLRNHGSNLEAILSFKQEIRSACYSLISIFRDDVTSSLAPHHRIFHAKKLAVIKNQKYKSPVVLSLRLAILEKVGLKLEEVLTNFRVSYNLPMLCPPKPWRLNISTGNYYDGGYLLIGPKNLISAPTKSYDREIVELSTEGLAGINAVQNKPYMFKDLSDFPQDFWNSDFILKQLEIIPDLEFKALEKKTDDLRRTTEQFLINEKSDPNFSTAYKNFRSDQYFLDASHRIVNKQSSLSQLINIKEDQDRIKNALASLQTPKNKTKKQLLAQQKDVKILEQASSIIQQRQKFDPSVLEKFAKFLDLNTKYILLKFQLASQQDKRARHDFNHIILKAYEGVKIYFPHILDFRGRAYPVVNGISKTAGLYKYFLKTAETFPYDPKSRLHLQASVGELIFNDRNACDFLNISPNKRATLEEAIDLTNKYASMFESSKPFDMFQSKISEIGLYFAAREYHNLLNNLNYTSSYIMLVDQSCSGPAILSFIFKDPYLARTTNLASPSQRFDLYTIWLDKFTSELTGNPTHENLYKAIRPILSRDLAKKFVMPFFYNISAEGMGKLAINRFRELDSAFKLKGQDRNSIETPDAKIIYEFARLAHASIAGLTLHIEFMQNFFTELGDIVGSANQPVTIKHPDSSIFTFGYYKIAFYPTRGYPLSSRTGRRIVYQIPRVTKEIDIKGQTRALSPNFIHSLDAYIIRSISLRFTQSDMMAPQTLHDCFGVHPSQLDFLLLSMKNIYIDVFSDEDFLCKHLLEPIKANISERTLVRKIENLEFKLKAFYTRIKSDQEVFDINDPKTRENYLKNPYSFYYGD
jgi:hypothetical protein